MNHWQIWRRFFAKSHFTRGLIVSGCCYFGTLHSCQENALGPHFLDENNGVRRPRQPQLGTRNATWSEKVHSYILTRFIAGATKLVFSFNDLTFSGIEYVPTYRDTNENKKNDETESIRSSNVRKVLYAANHTSYLDGGMLAAYLSDPHLYRFFYPSFDELIWTVGGCYVTFHSPMKSTVASLCNVLPIQPRVNSNGYDLRKDNNRSIWLKLSAEYFFPDISMVINAGYPVLIFPEGRIWQENNEIRDDDGRFVPSYECSAATRFGSKPYERIGPFYWGIGKLVARTECCVIPIGHYGNHEIAPNNKAYNLDFLKMRMGRSVHVAIGEPIDFSDILKQFRHKYGKQLCVGKCYHDTDSDQYQLCSCPIVGDSEPERQLYSLITAKVRLAVLRLESHAKDICEERQQQLQKQAKH